MLRCPTCVEPKFPRLFTGKVAANAVSVRVVGQSSDRVTSPTTPSTVTFGRFSGNIHTKLRLPTPGSIHGHLPHDGRVPFSHHPRHCCRTVGSASTTTNQQQNSSQQQTTNDTTTQHTDNASPPWRRTVCVCACERDCGRAGVDDCLVVLQP